MSAGETFKQQDDQENSRLLWEERTVFIPENQETSVHLGRKKKSILKLPYVNVKKSSN